jgi:hypothetical protein
MDRFAENGRSYGAVRDSGLLPFVDIGAFESNAGYSSRDLATLGSGAMELDLLLSTGSPEGFSW